MELKKLFSVGIPELIATYATFSAGSIPKTGMLASLKYFKSVPSFAPKSKMVSPLLRNDILLAAKKISFKVDKYGIVHASVGRASFTSEKISDNVNELVQTLHKLKPSSSKGIYFKSINLSSTMSPSITIDTKSIKESDHDTRRETAGNNTA